MKQERARGLVPWTPRWKWGLAAAGAAIAAPAAAESGPRFAYVTNQNGETVSVVDLDTFKVAATIKVPGKCAGVAVSPVSARVYVTCPDAHDVAVIDTATNAVVARWPAGKGPLGISLGLDRIAGATPGQKQELYVADWYDKVVHVLDAADGHGIAEIEVGQSPSGFADEAVADRDSNTVSFIDPQTHKRIGHVAVGERPFGMATVQHFGKEFAGLRGVITANVGSDDITIIEPDGEGAWWFEHPKVTTIKVGRRPYAVAVVPGRATVSPPLAFVTDQYGGTVSVIDLAMRAKIDTIEACDHPEGINYDWSRQAVYVACWFDNKLIRIDTTTRKITGEVAVGDGPRAFGTFLK